MNDLNYEQRLSEWSTFRDSLEASEDPLQDVINYYNKIPTVSIQTDPYTPSTWPSPWELINENMYCDFCRVLGMCYPLQLTDPLRERNPDTYWYKQNKVRTLLFPSGR